MKRMGCVVLGISFLPSLLSVTAAPPVDFTAMFIPPDEVRLSWLSVAGESYQIRSTMQLDGTWTPFVTDPAIFLADGSELTVNIPVVDGVRFFRVVRLGPEPQPVAGMVWIPAGTFTMGSPDSEEERDYREGPQTEVTFTAGFWMGSCEVTQAEYETVRGVTPSYWVGDDLPVESVNWMDAVAYCEELTQQEREAEKLPEGWEYRLPTEAQWEYACRAGTTTRFSFGDDDSDLGQYAWFGFGSDNTELRTHPVGQKLPNAWGLYDMHGNVSDWFAHWEGIYPGGSVVDPTGPITGIGRICRGGQWVNPPRACRSAARAPTVQGTKYSWIGFRVVLVSVR